MHGTWFRINALLVLSSLAVRWNDTLFGYEVAAFAAFTILWAPSVLLRRVLPDVVTAPDLWLGFSVAFGWVGALTYLSLSIRRARTRTSRAVASTLLLGAAIAGFGAFAIQQGRLDDLSRGFWLLCAGLASSVALEALVFSRRLSAGSETLRLT